ncbi:MAG: DinB family protein [Dehalococcoidia bacterium]
MNELQLLRSRRDAARAGTLEVLSRFEDSDLAFRPFDGGRDVGAAFRHIAHEEAIEVHWGLARLLDEMPPEPPSRVDGTEAVRELLARAQAVTDSYLDGLGPDALDDEVEMAWGDTMRRGDQLWHVLEHELHHRGELSLALGLLGRKGLDA